MGSICQKSEAAAAAPPAASVAGSQAAPPPAVVTTTTVPVVVPRPAPIPADNHRLLKPPPPWRDGNNTIKSSSDLSRKRDEFWDTAPKYEGKSEIWSALKKACEADTVDEAEAFIGAANITLPLGNLSLAYDELGGEYKIPAYCLSNPVDWGRASAATATALATSSTSTRAPPASAESASTVEEISISPRDGPTQAQSSAKITFRLRLPPHNKEVTMTVPLSTKVIQLKEQVSADHGIPAGRQRFFAGGRELGNELELRQSTVKPNTVVQVYERPADM